MRRRTIGDLLTGWEYDPEGLCLRLITGEDGREKLQIRLDLGLLQMELEGRPDGQRPHGHDSLLEYHLDRLATERRRRGVTDGFTLTPDDCADLRAEAMQFYHRYFSLFHLERFEGVVRDTARNLHVLDLCARYAEDAADREALEQYRPYIVMMNALARSELRRLADEPEAAARTLTKAIASIRAFVDRHQGQYRADSELQVLTDRLTEFTVEPPASDVERLQRLLDEAIEAEDYELAARLRDELTAVTDELLPPFWE